MDLGMEVGEIKIMEKIIFFFMVYDLQMSIKRKTIKTLFNSIFYGWKS